MVLLSNNIRNLFAAVITAILSVTLFDAVFHISTFDFRGYDTLGESIILLTAGLVVLLIIGKEKLGGKQ